MWRGAIRRNSRIILIPTWRRNGQLPGSWTRANWFAKWPANGSDGFPRLARSSARGAALLVPPGDPAALADALWRAGRAGPLRERLRDHGLARADALCWSRIATRVLHIYQTATAARPLLLEPAPLPA